MQLERGKLILQELLRERKKFLPIGEQLISPSCSVEGRRGRFDTAIRVLNSARVRGRLETSTSNVTVSVETQLVAEFTSV